MNAIEKVISWCHDEQGRLRDQIKALEAQAADALVDDELKRLRRHIDDLDAVIQRLVS
jgi:hypothetical protein